MLHDVDSAVPKRAFGPDRHLRVLFINDTSRNGGPGRTILYILKYLDPARVHRTLMLPRDGIVAERIAKAGAADILFFEPGLIENPLEPLGRQMVRGDFHAALPLKAARLAANLFRAGAGFARLLRRVRRERYDAILCNGTSAGFFGGGLAVLTGVPAIWHVLYPCVPPVVRPLHRFLAANRNVRLIVCVSQPTAPQFDHCRRKVRMIQTALDIDEFDPGRVTPTLRRDFAIGADTVVFGSHGRILPHKGYVELIRAARIVIDRLGAEDRARCRFIVLGDTPQDMKRDHLEECRALVRELGLDDYMQFVGFRPDVKSAVADFDVAVVPSVYEDPLPRAVMESMAMSKPVAAFAMGGIAEMIEDGVEGRLACGRPPDLDGLAKACLDYFHDPALRLHHGQAARRRIERDFDARKHALKLQEELFRVVGEARAAGSACHNVAD
ncbi:MAG TPA: glycosyltransferase [Rhizomicrobium sp.]|nr:glycosyltransferase [Rhizomicrobium sp.]